jgi:hypothetical protein
MPKIPGATIAINGNDYTVAALTLDQIKALRPQLEKLRVLVGVPADDDIAAIVEVVSAALSRNYSDEEAAKACSGLDLANLRPVIQAVMGVSGLVATGAPTGEA